MPIIERLISIIAPHHCVICGEEGSLLCETFCQGELRPLPSRCYRCRRMTKHSRTCVSCQSSSALTRVIVATEYSGAARELVQQLKFSYARAASQLLAQTMTQALFSYAENWTLVPVPTATSRVRERGYDQAALLARAIAEQTGLPRMNLLARSGQTRQVGMARTRRLQQLEQAFHVTAPARVAGMNVLLVDDVITTGATLEAAARVLRQAGARHVSALVFAQP